MYTKHNNFLSLHLNNSKYTLLGLLTLVSLLVGCEVENKEPPEELSLYRAGLSAYQQQRYSTAVENFIQLLSKFTTGEYADNAQLYRGRSYYWLRQYSAALTDFEAVLNTPSSDVLDTAQYWLAKTHHATSDFNRARLEYDKVKVSGVWYDNSRFQIGRTFYDESLTQTDPSQEFMLLSTAIESMQALIFNFPTSSSIDAAKYYLGKSYHNQFRLVKKYPLLGINNDPSAPQTYLEYLAVARSAYQSIDSANSYADDARYFDIRLNQETPPSIYDAGYFDALRNEYQTFISSFSDSSRIDDAQYQIGKTHYEQAQTLLIEKQSVAAMNSFSLAINQLNLLTTSVAGTLSGLADSASYYRGRSYHEQAILVTSNAQLASDTTAAALFDAARQSYQAVAVLDSTSSWIDNAQYQLASTYYTQATAAISSAEQAIVAAVDNATIQLHYDSAQRNLNQAINGYQLILTDPLLSSSSSADNAQYFSGRAYSRAAAIPASYRIDLSPDGINFFNINYRHAIDQFTPLVTEAKFSSSIWVDNAYYEIGNAFFQSALLETDLQLVKSNFESALSNYEQVVNNYPTSIRIDNAAYKIALVYHETGYCQLEQNWLNFTVSLLTTSASISAESTTHLTNLSLALITPTLIHPCVNVGSPLQLQLNPPPPPADTSLEQKVYQENLALFRLGLFNDAITQFQVQLATFPDGLYADNANLYLGRSYYEQLNYNQSLVYFVEVINNWNGSDSVAEAHYWAGRAKHSLGLYDSARLHYEKVNNGSPWRDNAIYNIAKSHYDQSKASLDPVIQFEQLDQAKRLFSTFLQNYLTSANFDNAQYFLGRSYHSIAVLLLNNTAVTADISASQAFSLAQDSYNAIVTTSSLADDAQYQLGRSYYDRIGLFPLANEQYSSLLSAQQFLRQFQLGNTLAGSNAAHSALYFLGRSRHTQAELLYIDSAVAPSVSAVTLMNDARTAYTAAINKEPFGTYADNAQYRLGRSHYSDAFYSVVPSDKFQSYEFAIAKFAEFDIGATYALSTLAHNALYFIGRSRHQQLSLLSVDSGLSSLTVADARTAAVSGYQAAISNNQWGQYADNANYYLGRIAYDQAALLSLPAEQMLAYDNAITYFILFDAGGKYFGYGFSHNALYYLGLSLEAQAVLVSADPLLSTKTAAQLNDEARKAYLASLNANPIGIYADNLAYQIGRNYFEQAKVLLTPTEAFLAFNNAITTLTDFGSGGLYENSFYAQRGRYFLAQSWHQQALLLSKDSNLSILSIEQAFVNAQTAYLDTVKLDPGGTYADNAQYLLGKSYYDYAGITLDNTVRVQNYESAIATFTAFNSAGAYAQSTYNDQASFFSARSYHQQALLLHIDPTLLADSKELTMNKARAQYLDTINLNSAGTYADNSHYQIGATHYDQAVWSQELAEQAILAGALTQEIQLWYTDMQNKLNSAMVEFELVLNNFGATNSADNAQFFLARSNHRAVNIAAQYKLDLSAIDPAATDFTAITHPEVRILYQALFDSVKFPNSNWVDNAHYETGNSFSEQALIESNIALKVDLYNSALTNYDIVINTYPDSVRYDNAVYYTAMVYHQTGYCLREENWLITVTTISGVEPQLLIDANLHLTDLKNAINSPTLDHSCDSTMFTGIN